MRHTDVKTRMVYADVLNGGPEIEFPVVMRIELIVVAHLRRNQECKPPCQ
jgi:hypothetical protein